MEAKALAMKEFGRAKMGHKSRTKRGVQIAEAFLRAPSDSIPRMFANAHQAKGAYRFFSNGKVTHEGVLSGHMEQTVERCVPEGTILVIQDTTTLTYTTHKKTKGLGPINDRRATRGMLVHTALAVSAERHEVLGILDQMAWVRSEKKHPKEETSRDRQRRKRESERWRETERRVAERLGKKEVRVISLMDREGDIFEVFEEMNRLGHGFVIRAARNRLLELEEGEEIRRYSLEEVLKAPIRAGKTVEIPARNGQAARSAKLEIRAMTVTVQPPKSRDRKGESVTVNLVVAVECGVPNGAEPLVWYLITSEPIETEADVLKVIRYYEARWTIEELHMGIKTGCACEERQLQTSHALKNFLAMASVMAWQMLALRDAARRNDPIPASRILTSTQLAVLCGLRPRLPRDCTAAQALRSIAGMGGFMERTHDGHPGWRTLWRGMTKLLIAESGYLVAKKSG